MGTALGEAHVGRRRRQFRAGQSGRALGSGKGQRGKRWGPVRWRRWGFFGKQGLLCRNGGPGRNHIPFQTGEPRPENAGLDASPQPAGNHANSSKVGVGIDGEVVQSDSESSGSVQRDDASLGGHREPSSSEAESSNLDSEFYDLFLRKLAQACGSSPKTPGELAELFELQKTQLDAWLKRAQVEEKVQRRIRPVRYEWIDARQICFLIVSVNVDKIAADCVAITGSRMRESEPFEERPPPRNPSSAYRQTARLSGLWPTAGTRRVRRRAGFPFPREPTIFAP